MSLSRELYWPLWVYPVFFVIGIVLSQLYMRSLSDD